MTTHVIDTADWLLAQPVKAVGDLDLSGTPLSLALTSTFGGPPIAEASTEAGTLAFVPAAGGTAAYFAIDMLVADRTWRISRPTSVFGDILRVPQPGHTEWVGRVALTVHPGSASGGILQPAASPVLSPVQPYGGRLALGAMVIGPQGIEGRDGASGNALTFTASSVLSGHQAVRALSDGTVAYASASQLSHVGSVVGVTVAAASAGEPVAVQQASDLVEPSWNWAIGPVFLGENGALTQTVPATGFRQQIGLAVSPTRLVIALGPVVIL